MYPKHDRERALLDEYHRIDGTALSSAVTEGGTVAT